MGLKPRYFVNSMTMGPSALNFYTVVHLCYLVIVLLLLRMSLLLKQILHALLVMCPPVLPALSQCAVKAFFIHAVYISVLRVASSILRHSTALQ